MSLFSLFDNAYNNLGALPSKSQVETPLSYNQIRVKKIKAKKRRKQYRSNKIWQIRK